VAVALRVTDDVSGVDRITITYESPSGAETASVVLDAADRISGDAFDGTYQGTVPIPQLGQNGTWSVKTIRVVDAFGLFADLAPGAIPPPGPQTVAVSSTPDGNAPQLVSLTVTPTVVNVATGAVLVEVTARITDDVTGVTDGALLIRSPDDLSSLAVTLGPAQRISGDNLDGTYQNSVSFPQDSPRGWWGFEFFTNDAAGNGVQLTGGAPPGQSGIAVTATTATASPRSPRSVARCCWSRCWRPDSADFALAAEPRARSRRGPRPPQSSELSSAPNTGEGSAFSGPNGSGAPPHRR
jgi:hypothetical protein